MLEKTGQSFAGATISLAGVLIGSLIVGLAWHKAGPDRQVGDKAGGGVRDTPIVMEGGSIVFDSDTQWTCIPLQPSPQGTTCTTTLAPDAGGHAQSVKRIKVVELDESKEKFKVPGIDASDTWTLTFYTTASEQEVMFGKGNLITVKTSANAQFMLSDQKKELTIFPFDTGNFTNKISAISASNVDAAGHTSSYGPVLCASGSGMALELNRCFVHFKVKDQ